MDVECRQVESAISVHELLLDALKAKIVPQQSLLDARSSAIAFCGVLAGFFVILIVGSSAPFPLEFGVIGVE